MILRLEVPFLDTHTPGGSLRTWHVQEGQEVGYGDPLCDIIAEDYVALQRSLRPYEASRVVRDNARAFRPTETLWKRGRVELIYRVMSSEFGKVWSIYAPEGSNVSTGDLLALVSSGDEDVVELDPAAVDAPHMKVVARSVELLDEA